MKTSVNIKMEENVRDEAREIIKKMGLDLTTAINMFLLTVIREQAIPFPITAQNYNFLKENFQKEMWKAIDKSEEDILNGKTKDINTAYQELKVKYGL